MASGRNQLVSKQLCHAKSLRSDDLRHQFLVKTYARHGLGNSHRCCAHASHCFCRLKRNLYRLTQALRRETRLHGVIPWRLDLKGQLAHMDRQRDDSPESVRRSLGIALQTTGSTRFEDHLCSGDRVSVLICDSKVHPAETVRRLWSGTLKSRWRRAQRGAGKCSTRNAGGIDDSGCSTAASSRGS